MSNLSRVARFLDDSDNELEHIIRMLEDEIEYLEQELVDAKAGLAKLEGCWTVKFLYGSRLRVQQEAVEGLQAQIACKTRLLIALSQLGLEIESVKSLNLV